MDLYDRVDWKSDRASWWGVGDFYYFTLSDTTIIKKNIYIYAFFKNISKDLFY